MLDLVIINGNIIDGTGRPGYAADIGIKGDRIVTIGRLDVSGGIRHIDASGRTVCPGFVDIHSHADLNLVSGESNPKVAQGVTTEVIGNCGLSVYPVKGPAFWSSMYGAVWGEHDISLWSWSGYPDYVRALSARHLPVNAACLTGYGAVRCMVMGMDPGPPEAKERSEILSVIRGCMEQGSPGVSFGMPYPPCSYATDEEIISAAREAASFSGYIACHIMSEGTRLLESVAYFIDVARKASVRLHISHLKAYGRKNWPKTGPLLEMIDRATSDTDISFDQYPYTAGSTTLLSLLPEWVFEGDMGNMLRKLADPGTRDRIVRDMADRDKEREDYVSLMGWENIRVLTSVTEENGRSVEELAALRSTGPAELVCDIISREKGQAGMLLFGMDESSVERIMVHPRSCVGTDGLYFGTPHPRTYGTYPRIIQKYVMEKRLLSLEGAVMKMSSFPADRAGLGSLRGRIEAGCYADLVVMDPGNVRENCSYTDPVRAPSGIDNVIVNGVETVNSAAVASVLPSGGKSPGRVLSRAVR